MLVRGRQHNLKKKIIVKGNFLDKSVFRVRCKTT